MEHFVNRYKTHLAFIVLIGILLYAKSLADSAAQNRQRGGQSLSAQDQLVSPTPTVTSTPTPTPTPTPLRIPTKTPTSTDTPKAAQDILDFYYPGATQISLDGDTLILESLDDSDKTTDWYKNKINSLGMNAKSFVVTKTNGNVLNKLVADNGEWEIRVEITRKRSQSTTEIVVTVRSS